MVAVRQRITSIFGEGFPIGSILLWIIRITFIAMVLVGSFRTITSGVYSLSRWRDLIVSGVSQGSIYALIALGYTMVYGVLRFINFAHGEVFMSGAMIGYFVATALDDAGIWNGSPLLALFAVLLTSVFTAAGITMVLERVAYRPLRGAPRLVPLITSIGAAFFLQYAFLGLFGGSVKAYPRMDMLQGRIDILGFVILKIQLVVIVAAVVMMVGLYWFVERTKTGKAIRAVSEEPEIAALMGINVNRTIVTTFLIGGVMAGVAATLYVMTFNQVTPFIGFTVGIKAFTAAVLGGIGNIVGAMLGGLLLGVVESVGPILVLSGLGVPSPHQLKDVVAFTVLVLVLIFRPTGILGERLAEEKA
jgi:branched-chain amino acid transport system permease protein